MLKKEIEVSEYIPVPRYAGLWYSGTGSLYLGRYTALVSQGER